MGGPPSKPVKPTPAQAQVEKGAVADSVAVVVIEDGVLPEVKTKAQPNKKPSWSKRIAGGVVTLGTIGLGSLLGGGKDASPTTPAESVVPSALYPSTTSLFPETARYKPTKKELKSEEGNFRLDFSPYPELEKGQGNYYIVDSDTDGSYVFKYDEALGNELVAEGYAPYCLWFTLTDREGVVTKIDHAPLGDGVASTSGHFYESDKTKSEKGKYMMHQGDALVGKGTYYYYRVAGKTRAGTSRATYSDATFYYLYFADQFDPTADTAILPSASADEVVTTTIAAPPVSDPEGASAPAAAVDDEPAATTPVTAAAPAAATPIAPAAVSAAAIPPPVTTLSSMAEEPPAPAEPQKMTVMEELPMAVLLPAAPTPEPFSAPTSQPTNAPSLSPSSPPTLVPSSTPTRAPSSLAPTKQPTIAPSSPPTTMATAAATMVQYTPTDEELNSPLGNYRLYYAQSNNWEPGGWYFLDQKSSIEGEYTFYYDDPQAVAPGEKYVYHYVYKSPRAIGGQISIKYAPIGQSESASGLLHKGGVPGIGVVGGGDYTTSEKGKYYLQEGNQWESGTYYYYRIPGKKTGRDGYLSESTFYYLYFPSSHSTVSRKAGFRL